MLATSNNVLFPGQNQLLPTGTDDPSLACAWAIIKVMGHQYRWLAGGYDLEIGHLYRWLAWWLPGGYIVFLAQCIHCTSIYYKNACGQMDRALDSA